jgi:hypothetical protein
MQPNHHGLAKKGWGNGDMCVFIDAKAALFNKIKLQETAVPCDTTVYKNIDSFEHEWNVSPGLERVAVSSK